MVSLNNLSLGLDIGQLFNSLTGKSRDRASGDPGDHGVLNIGQYRKLIDNFSRPYLFLIEIPYIGKVSPNTVTIFCSSTSLPEFKIETSQIKFQDQRLNVGSVSRFETPWVVEFLLDEQHSLRNALIQWGQMIYNVSSNSHGSPSSYKADNLKVVQLDRNGKVICGCTFVGAFPTQIGPVQFSSGSSSEVSKFEAQFTYDYWVMHEAGFPEEPGDALGERGGILGGVFASFGPGGGRVGGSIGSSLGGVGLNVGGAFGF